MIPLSQLEKAVREGLAYLRGQEDVVEGEVYTAANGVLLTRLNYTSHIPCNGVEEPKSVVNYGVGVQAAFKGADGDPEFKSLARPTGEQRKLKSYHDPKVLDIKDADLADAGWRVVNGALRVSQTSESLGNLAERPGGRGGAGPP